MAAFHEAHFSQLATDHFQTQFLRPEHPPAENTTHNAADDEEYYEEEDDGLGYYPDGVKRTLTDEQIAIFRHSELEALRRVKESSKIRKETTNTNSEEDAAHDLSEGEVSSPTPSGATAKKSKKRKRGKTKNKNKNIHMGEPIDLRKRTWDVVDKGLATLDYDEENNESVETSAIQRRRISYDD
jgi:hypothetical protein